LVIEEASTAARQEQAARTDTLVGTLAAIKLELGGDRDLINALWKAVLSPVITAGEQIDFLDLCRMVCYPKESLVLKLKYPRYWKVRHHGKVCYIGYSCQVFTVLTGLRVVSLSSTARKLGQGWFQKLCLSLSLYLSPRLHKLHLSMCNRFDHHPLIWIKQCTTDQNQDWKSGWDTEAV